MKVNILYVLILLFFTSCENNENLLSVNSNTDLSEIKVVWSLDKENRTVIFENGENVRKVPNEYGKNIFYFYKGGELIANGGYFKETKEPFHKYDITLDIHDSITTLYFIADGRYYENDTSKFINGKLILESGKVVSSGNITY